MFPPTNLTFGSIVNVVVRGDCDVAKLSNVVAMMLCSETPPNFFVSCLVGERVVCSVCPVGAAEATPAKAITPITPTSAPNRTLRLRIPLHSLETGVWHSCRPVNETPASVCFMRRTEILIRSAPKLRAFVAGPCPGDPDQHEKSGSASITPLPAGQA